MKFPVLKKPKLNIKIKKKYFVFFFLVLILAMTFFLRVYFPWESVFQDPVRYAADDGVYHMRLIENMVLGDHFPQRLFFDAYTNFPQGTYIIFAPFYDYLIGFVIWIAAWGNPTIETVHAIAPFYPPALGTLAVLLVFFIGKNLWGNLAGLLSAFFASISQPFLFRSILGATDHHQAEVLYSTLAILFLILAFQHFKEKRKFWIYTILAGIGLGLYFLNWPGALLFLFIVFISIVGYYAIEYFSGRENNWILICGIVVFAIALFMITPFFGHPDIMNSPLYNINHLASLVIGIQVFACLLALSYLIKKNNLN